MYQSVNFSSCLVGVNDDWVTCRVIKKSAPELPKGFELPPTENYLDPSVMINNMIVSTLSMLV